MTVSRRRFIQWTAAITALAPRGLRAAEPRGYRAELLPSQKEVWDQQVWMARLGPKYTGNPAHATFVDFLASSMQALGLEVQRDRYTFDRWEASGQPTIASKGRRFDVSSYFPYSGSTGAEGTTGELVYAGSNPRFDLSGVRGKVALVDFTINTRDWAHQYQAWGIHPPTETFPSASRPARGAINDLTPFQTAGAVAVIIRWLDVSPMNAADQYTPFSRPPQNIPGVYVGRDVGARLRALAGTGVRVTVVLEAETTADAPTETIVATLPGASDDDIVMLNTHTDGPNATEENGALGLVALAKYFSKIPRAERRRSLVFPMTTGHFAGPWVPSIRGFIQKNPDLIKKTVAAVTVEHLGCREWLDEVATGGAIGYRDTGRMEWSVAITPSKPMANLLVDAVQGSLDRAGVVNPVKGGFLGEGSSLSRAGIPTIGYIPQPNYLLAGPADGCIEKLSPELMHSQIEVFAKLVHRINGLTAAELRA